MKGDFSKLPFHSRQPYTGVLLQQGRVQLDSDWNEEMAILAYQRETRSADLIGACGSPAGNRGFEITVRTALHFSSDGQHAALRNPEALLFAEREPFTIEVWVCPESGYGPIFSAAGGYLLSLETDGSVCFEREEIVHRRGVETEIEIERIGRTEIVVIEEIPVEERIRIRRRVKTHRAVASSVFSHVAVTYDGALLSIFIDGELSAREALAGEGRRGEGSALIGAVAQNDKLVSFRGRIGEIQIWSRAWSGKQIRERLRNEREPRRHDLVAWHQFDEGSGWQAADASGNGHDAVLGAAAGGEPPAWDREVWIERGRYYVEGALIQNDATVLFGQQPHYPGAALPGPQDPPQYFLAYLDVWDRLITALEDPGIREPALGGPDTATRIQAIWQIKLLPLGESDPEGHGADIHPRWAAFLARPKHRLRMTAARPSRETLLENQLYRVEIHSGGYCPRADEQGTWQAEAVPGVAGGFSCRLWPPPQDAPQVGDTLRITSPSEAYAFVAAVDPAQRTFTVSLAQPLSASSICFHRVPTFKWSRENGSIAFPVRSIYGGNAVVLDRSQTDEWSIQPGDWVELGDDNSVLRNQPHRLLQIAAIDHDERRLVVKFAGANAAQISADPQLRPFLRRWDQRASVLPWGVTAIAPGVAARLEAGIEVTFSAGGFCDPGDYWQIPARAISGDLECPPGQAVSPLGIRHRHCPLALLRADSRGVEVSQSYRRSFLPLAEVTAEEALFVRRAGDVMTGQLRIESSLHVAEAAEVGGPMRIGGPVEAGDSLRAAETVVARRLHAEETLRVDGRAQIGESVVVRGGIEGHAGLRMSGPVHMRDSVEVGLLRGRLDEEIVGTPQIRDRSVTPEKLSFPVAPDLHGFSLLHDSPQHVPGFRSTGLSFLVWNPELRHAVSGQPPEETIVAAVAVGDQIFVFTGVGGLWKWEPPNHWQRSAPLPDTRTHFSAAAAGGRIFVFGGHDGEDRSNRVSEYDPARNRWSERTPMPTPRHSSAACARDGRIHVIGGLRKGWFGSAVSRAHEEYDPQADAWNPRSPLPARRYGFALGESQGSLYAIGGLKAVLGGLLGRTTSRDNERYDAYADAWSRCRPMPDGAFDFGMAAFDARLFAMGGEATRLLGLIRGRTNAVRQYDPAADHWSYRQPLVHAPRRPVFVPLRNTVYGAGGAGRAHVGRIWPVVSAYFVFQRDEPSRKEDREADASD